MANVVIGVEIDTVRNNVSVMGFCSWTIASKPGHPVMKRVVYRVMENLKGLAEKYNTTLSDMKVKQEEVIRNTGPSAFSRAVFESLSQITGTNVTLLNVTGLTQPKLISDVLILPINSFGSGQKHSGSGSPDEESALVHHLFKGSWRPSHPQ